MYKSTKRSKPKCLKEQSAVSLRKLNILFTTPVRVPLRLLSYSTSPARLNVDNLIRAKTRRAIH